MAARGFFTKLFGDFGHTVRTLVIAGASTALVTWSYNSFIKAPIGSLSELGNMRKELTQVRSEFDAYKASEKERWIKRQAESKEVSDKINAINVDVAWLKGRVK